MATFQFDPHICKGNPDFTDLPWTLPIHKWTNDIFSLEDVPHGISRHPIVFVRYDGFLYVIKELPHQIAQREHDLLVQIHSSGLPSINPVGYAFIKRDSIQSSILFTQYLESSVPYRTLFINKQMEQYQDHLLDAISGLMVQIHSTGFYWGDCSLSNILFRRDAGALQAYLVDAETAELHTPPLSPMLRFHDLEIMEENIFGELTDLQMSSDLSLDYPVERTGPYIQEGYQRLWEEITREEVFTENELFRVDERIRKLNSLGFSVKDIELKKEGLGNTLKLRIFVSDRNFHRNQLLEITGLKAEERQAQQILNEINELRASMSHTQSADLALETVASYWMENIYQLVIIKLHPIIDSNSHSEIQPDMIELYCQVLEHKWYLSERAQHDVGHQAAVEDFVHQFS